MSGGETPIETAGILYLLVNTYSGPVPGSESLTTLFFPKTLSPPLIEACAKSGTALEINANPARLDLSDVHARRALDRGCWLTIDTDAHGPDNFDLLPYGIATARRGWVTPDRVLNCLLLEELLEHLTRRVH